MMQASIAQQEYRLVEQTTRMMATDVSVHVAVPPAEEASAQAAIAACMAWLREVEQRLTRFNPESELCQLNNAAGHWRGVSRLTFTAVQEALIAAEMSDGLFDPTLLPQLEALGYDRDFAQITSEAATLPETQTGPSASDGSWHRIQMDARRQRIHLPEGTRLDLGGIAKGWAADAALKRCFRSFENVIINVGGDLRLRGQRQPDEHWAVGIRDPRYDHRPGPTPNIAVLTLGQGGLATSGGTHRFWQQGGQRRHHLLDPRTGLPANVWISFTGEEEMEEAESARLIATATALAPTTARAEAATKVALLRGYPDALHAVEQAWAGAAQVKADKGVALLLVLGTGEVVLSANMQAYLDTCGGGGMVWM
ncbi:MAG TPA: FAD:protein FMN transferase [Ktedonobacterales bacterium]|jgi:thiamine biosynthesis lipoprotein